MFQNGDRQSAGQGCVVEAAEVPGPTFTHVVDYAHLKTIADSPAFVDLRSQLVERQTARANES